MNERTTALEWADFIFSRFPDFQKFLSFWIFISCNIFAIVATNYCNISNSVATDPCVSFVIPPIIAKARVTHYPAAMRPSSADTDLPVGVGETRAAK